MDVGAFDVDALFAFISLALERVLAGKLGTELGMKINGKEKEWEKEWVWVRMVMLAGGLDAIVVKRGRDVEWGAGMWDKGRQK